jgi:ABC-type transport system involved in multi-copper enzyme maturation permease subunit
MREVAKRLVDGVLLLKLALRWQLGRRAWLVAALALGWPAYHALSLLAGWRDTRFAPADAQNYLIGLPLIVLAIGLGVGIIAGEIEQRTLEVTYTVPGGARRVWLAKLLAAALPLLAACALLAVVTAAFFTSYPLPALYGALQGAAFYLVLAMGLGALLRSELTAALVTAMVLFVNGFLSSFGETPRRWSPLFNPLAVTDPNSSELLAWTIQNRIGVALLILALVALSCVRAERREQLLRI